MNERLLAKDPPGWTATELLDELLTRTVRIVAFDFPFSVPDVLLRDEEFAANAGYTHGAFIGWRTFNAFVAERLPLGEPLDFRPFDPWRSRSDRARLWARRATDIVAGGQPPLKDKLQATLQMTLLGNAVLSRLRESRRYRVSAVPGRARHRRGHRSLPGCDAAFRWVWRTTSPDPRKRFDWESPPARPPASRSTSIPGSPQRCKATADRSTIESETRTRSP